MEQVIIIPGFLQGPYTLALRRIAREFKREGKEVHIMRIHWIGRTMSDWLEELDVQLRDICIPSATVLGYSYGAMLAVMFASRQTPQRLILCSMADSWADSPAVISPSWWARHFEKGRTQDFKTYNFDAIAPMIASPTDILIGEKEAVASNPVWHLALRTQQLIEGSEISIVDNAWHMISHPQWRQTFRKLFAKTA